MNELPLPRKRRWDFNPPYSLALVFPLCKGDKNSVKFFALRKVKLQPAVAVKFAYRQAVAVIDNGIYFLRNAKNFTFTL